MPNSCKVHDQYTEYLITPKSSKKSLCIQSPFSHSSPLGNTNLVSVPIAIPFPECQINGIIQNEVFLSRSFIWQNASEKLPCYCVYQTFAPFYCLNISLLCGCTTIPLSAPQLADIRVVYSFFGDYE